MSTVRVLVGTKKGAFILTSDGARQKWHVAGAKAFSRQLAPEKLAAPNK